MEWYRNLTDLLLILRQVTFWGASLQYFYATFTVDKYSPPDVITPHCYGSRFEGIDGLMLMTRGTDIQRYLEQLGSYDMLKELKTLLYEHQELLQTADGNRATVEAIGEFHLYLPIGLVLILHNCHYSPSITRGIISVSCLYKDGFVNRFDNDNTILVSRNNLVYFNAIPQDDIYEIDLSSSNTNDNSMYAVSNKRAKLNLDSTLLWRCEYTSQEFSDHLKDHGIISHQTPPYTPQHNGVSERRNRTLLNMVRSMMSQTTLLKSFWDYALKSAAHILNMVSTKKALVKRDALTKPDKLEPKSIKCIFVGYSKETIGYSFYYPPENKVFVAQNAEFFENSLITQEASGSLKDLGIIQEEDTHPSIDTSLHHEEDDQEIWDLDEPANYKSALLDPESNKWLNAMNVEMQSMRDNEKTDIDGAVHTYKARLVAKGFSQTLGIDYKETFSPVADIRAIRIFIAIATFYDYEIWQMDVKTAFLNGYLNEEVYMKQPEGFVNPKYPNRVCKLKRSICRLKQASRQWNKRFDDKIKKFGFSQNRDEPYVYMKASESYVTFLILYVDDILIMENYIPMLQDVKSYFGICFAMKDLGEATYILGIKIYQDRSRRLIGLCQSVYIEKILKRYFMENSKRRIIPIQEKLKLSKSQEYEKLILIESRVSCYSDAGYLTDPDNLKSQTGYVFILNGGAVNWKSTKQSIFATSSIDAEYIAAFDASKEVVWIQKFISGLGVVPTIKEPISMYCDNTGAIAITKEHGITKGARHFHAKVHYL
ncbi:retrotransposon protein, putative, ty1-copia subclass [Tanacetum coccineum]